MSIPEGSQLGPVVLEQNRADRNDVCGVLAAQMILLEI